MSICINCGQDTGSFLCDKCKMVVDYEKLCDQLMEYTPGAGENELWDRISSELDRPYEFKNVIFYITENIPSPRREYRRMLCWAGEAPYISKNFREWLYGAYKICKECEGLSETEMNRVKGLVLDALYKDYYFEEAEKLANEIMKCSELPKQVYMTLADFYTKTRRYDMADKFLSELQNQFGQDEREIQNLINGNNKQRENANLGKKEYIPNPRENKEEARKKYVDFMASIGIEVEAPKTGKRVKPIPKDQYPAPVETKDATFDSFVAFDLETTGINSKVDSIIEFGAIKVVNGQIVDSQEFVFQEYVKPYKRELVEEVQELTGISPDDVKEAREFWDVTPDFMKFVGDDVLVGFNCMAFDCKFMVRAGRYSHIIINNQYFDVMHYASQFKEQLGLESKRCSLGVLSKKLNIENPRAHRALADAITTARVYIKLREMDNRI